MTKRIIVCLDVRQGKVTKGIKFQNNIDLGDPVEMAAAYSSDGCDELVFYDIMASAEKRSLDMALLKKIAQAATVPLTVGGGIGSIEDIQKAIEAGAAKISLNSLAVRRPEIIAEGAKIFGSAAIVLGMDPIYTPDNVQISSQYEVVVLGGRQRTGLDAVQWAKQAVNLGAGEIVVNSIDADGTRQGYDLRITRLIAEALDVPVVASGGAGCTEHLIAAFKEGKAAAALVAGMVHTGDYTVTRIKQELCAAGIPVRKTW